MLRVHAQCPWHGAVLCNRLKRRALRPTSCLLLLSCPAAPTVRRVLTPQAVQEFELSRKALITPQHSVTEEAPQVGRLGEESRASSGGWGWLGSSCAQHTSVAARLPCMPRYVCLAVPILLVHPITLLWAFSFGSCGHSSCYNFLTAHILQDAAERGAVAWPAAPPAPSTSGTAGGPAAGSGPGLPGSAGGYKGSLGQAGRGPGGPVAQDGTPVAGRGMDTSAFSIAATAGTSFTEE